MGYRYPKGHIVSQETREKIRKALTGRKLSLETRLKLTGRKHTEETKIKIGNASRGRIKSPETRLKLSLANKGRPSHNKGKPMSEEQKIKIGNANRGEKSVCWRGGITHWRKKIYHSKEYKDWRKAVFERDNYTCVWCGITKVELHADHIKPFGLYPELRTVLNNGRTLCVPCHRKTDTWGRSTQDKLKNKDVK